MNTIDIRSGHPVQLPDLTSTTFSTLDVSVRVAVKPGITCPSLLIEGDDSVFERPFIENGALTVRDKRHNNPKTREERMASLWLPPGMVVSHNISTAYADITICGDETNKIEAKRIVASTNSGRVALQHARLDDLSLRCGEGSLEVVDVVAKNGPYLFTDTARLTMRRSKAPIWNITTLAGDINTSELTRHYEL